MGGRCLAASFDNGFLAWLLCEGGISGTTGGRVALGGLLSCVFFSKVGEGRVLGVLMKVAGEVECCNKSTMKDNTAALTTTAASRESTIAVC